MKRKIIQVIDNDKIGWQVLCDDGTIWEIDGIDGFPSSTGKHSWKQMKLPDIPEE